MATPEGHVLVVQRPGEIDRLVDRFASTIDRAEMLTATDVPSATATVRSEDVICVVSDFEVPDEHGIEYLSGIDLLEAVRAIDDLIPVVLFTETGHEDAADVAIDAGATNYVTRCVSGPSIDELARRVQQLVAKRRAERRAEQQAHLNEVLRDVNQTLVRASTREEIELGVCRQLSRGSAYAHAVFYVDADDEIDVRAQSAPDDVTVTSSVLSPLSDVISPDSVTLFATPDAFPDSLRAFATEHGYGSMLAVPVAYRADRLGVVALFATTTDAFDETQQSVFAELGDTIGYALSAVETRVELARQNERLDEFARTVSHDLRNPLTILNGRIELAREAGDPEHFAAIERATERMETLIDDMLRRAREADIEHERPVSLASIANSAWQQVQTGEAALVIEGDRTIAADPGRLQQLFENLIRNAIEHGSKAPRSGATDEGVDGVSRSDPITIRVGPLADGFFVADDGVGIPEFEQSVVFEQGYSRNPDGTGYGLAIVSQIVDNHGWGIVATDSEDGGARFEITGVTLDPHAD